LIFRDGSQEKLGLTFSDAFPSQYDCAFGSNDPNFFAKNAVFDDSGIEMIHVPADSHKFGSLTKH